MTIENPAPSGATGTDTSVQTTTTPVTPVTPPAGAAAPQTPVTPEAAGDASDPKWLNNRIAQAKAAERAAVLKELGAATTDEAKTAIAAKKAGDDAKKTAEERAAEATAKATALEAQNAKALQTISEFAARQMLALTPEQQAAVKAVAGDDASAQLRTIEAMQPTWGKAEAAKKPDGAPTQAGGASTAPNPNGPPPAGTSPTNVRAQYEELRRTNPIAAAAFGAANPAVYDGAK